MSIVVRRAICTVVTLVLFIPLACTSGPVSPPTASTASTSPSAPGTPSAPSSPATPSASAAGASPTTRPTPSNPLAAVVDLDLTLAGGPDFPVAGFGSIWVLRPDLDPPNIVRLDPATGETLAEIPYDEGLCQALGVSPDAIWACSTNGIARIDPDTNTLVGEVNAAIGQYYGLLPFGAGSLWALGGKVTLTDTLLRIDPDTMTVADRIPLGFNGGGLAFDYGAVWITATVEGRLVRFDPNDGELTDHVEGLPAPRMVTSGFGSLWVGLHDSRDEPATPGAPTVARIDPATGRIQARIAVSSTALDAFLHAGVASLWVRSADPFVARVDPASNEVIGSIKANWGIGGVVEFDERVWVTAGDMYSKVWRLKPGAP